MSSKPKAGAPSKGKKVAPPPKGVAGSVIAKKQKQDWKTQHKHLFEKDARVFKIGRDIQPKRDLSRFVRWPRYVRLQRQRKVLKLRLKVPPAVNQFTKTLNKNQASSLFKLLAHYRPESPEDKQKRLAAAAQNEAKGQPAEDSKKPRFVKYGINHITTLIEQRKAKLVVIAHDVEPVELVIFLPALCRKMEVPYVIIKGKARLGHLVHKKTATAVALTDVRKEHVAQLEQIADLAKAEYSDAVQDRRKWGGGVMGAKAQAVIRKRERQNARDIAQKAGGK